MTDEKKDKATWSAERARQIILQRRARFVAAALAGLGGAACDGGPQVCLSLQGPEPDDTMDAGARVCLSMLRDAGRADPGKKRDAGASDAGRDTDGGAENGADGGPRGIDAGPQVCLSVFELRGEPEAPEVDLDERES